MISNLDEEIREQIMTVNELIDKKEWGPAVFAIFDLLTYTIQQVEANNSDALQIKYECKQCGEKIPMHTLEKHLKENHFK